MIALGVNAGDRVAIWSPNTWHWVVACLATHYAGAVVVPLNTRYTAVEASDILARTGAPLLFAMGQFLGTDDSPTWTAPHCPRCGTSSGYRSKTATTGPGTSSSAPGTDLAAVDARAAAVHPDDVSDILFTSGTTGRSKGVLCAHRQSLAGVGVVGRLRQDHQRRPLPVHQPVLPQLRLQGRHPGLPADRRDADPAPDFDPAGDAGGRGTPHHRTARAADDLPDAARSSRRAATTT